MIDPWIADFQTQVASSCHVFGDAQESYMTVGELLKEEVGHAEFLPKLWQNSLQWFSQPRMICIYYNLLYIYIYLYNTSSLTV